MHQTNEGFETQKKKQSKTWLVILLVVFLILFLLTTAILGAQLYELATRDRYTVDLGVGEMDGSIELFRIQYANESGEITVQGINGDNVVAPGTSVEYAIRLRNNDDRVLDFVMIPTVEFLTDDKVPVEFKIVDDYGNYILGSRTEWVGADEMNALAHKGSIHPGEVFSYHVTWRWVFEVGDDQNQSDTDLGNQDGIIAPGVCVGVSTEAVANPHLSTKDITHLTHLWGESFGCCWCCYLVWLLLLLVVLLLVWLFRLCRKVNKLEKLTEEYRQIVDEYEDDGEYESAAED